MRILRVTRSANPKGGGVIEAIRLFGLAHQSLGHTVEVATLDQPNDPALSGFPLPLHTLGPAANKYGFSSRLRPWLEANRERFDAVIIDGLWQYHVLATYRALRGTPTPWFVYPHGMLDPWFRRNYPLKHLKKWLYWPWADYRALRDARRVFFTCDEERRLARQSFWLYRAEERVAPLGIARPPEGENAGAAAFFNQHPGLAGKRLLLFMARLHEKKGCDLLVEAFASVAATDASLHLVMAGPDQIGWQSTLQERAEASGISKAITWTGMLNGDAKWSALHACEAFILPSHQENFGIAVVEALACGKPVFISDKVNIWREIVTDGAGFAQPDTLAGTTKLLRQWVALKEPAREQLGNAARECFERHFEINFAARHLIDELRSAGVRA